MFDAQTASYRAGPAGGAATGPDSTIHPMITADAVVARAAVRRAKTDCKTPNFGR
jgi:hypothetical protein